MKPQCVRCHAHPISRPRGLCWVCYYTPGVRQQHPSTSKYAQWANGQAATLSASTIDDGPEWYVVGELPDGDRIILDAAASRSTAYRRRSRLAAHCDQYVAIDVERAGQARKAMLV